MKLRRSLNNVVFHINHSFLHSWNKLFPKFLLTIESFTNKRHQIRSAVLIILKNGFKFYLLTNSQKIKINGLTHFLQILLIYLALNFYELYQFTDFLVIIHRFHPPPQNFDEKIVVVVEDVLFLTTGFSLFSRGESIPVYSWFLSLS